MGRRTKAKDERLAGSCSSALGFFLIILVPLLNHQMGCFIWEEIVFLNVCVKTVVLLTF